MTTNTKLKIPRIFTAIIISLSLAILFTINAFAHVNLTRSFPADGDILDSTPVHVQLWFSEELDTFESKISVIDSDGMQVDLGDSQVNPSDRTELRISLSDNLPSGVFNVDWNVTDDKDSHPISGEFEFTIQSPQANSPLSNSWPAILLTFMSLIGFAIFLIIRIKQRKRKL